MTSPGGTSGDEPITAPGIHDDSWTQRAAAPRTQKQMRATGEAMVDILLAHVFYAFAGVSIFGVSPFGFMRAWADDLVQRANDAYNNAGDAQAAADTANSGVATLTGTAALPPGGVQVTDNFDRTGSDLGSDWAWYYSGSGSGAAAPDGENLAWTVAGGASRIIRARHDTVLATDRQYAALVQTAPQNASNTDPELRLILRSDATMDNFLMANWTSSAAAIGMVVAGSYTQLGAAVSHSAKNGARWAFWAGIDNGADPDEDYVLRLYLNDALLLERVDTAHTSLLGASYRHGGCGMLAGVTFDAFGFHQKAPPKIQTVTISDRA